MRYGGTGNGVRLFKARTAILSNSCGFGFNDELIWIGVWLGTSSNDYSILIKFDIPPSQSHQIISHILLDALPLFSSMTEPALWLFGIVRHHLPFRVIIPTESNYMKQFLLLVLAAVGLVALIPTQSKAQVTISVGPGYSNGYYPNGYYYQGQPYYYRHHANRYHTYHYNQRYYRSHQWYNND